MNQMKKHELQLLGQLDVSGNAFVGGLPDVGLAGYKKYYFRVAKVLNEDGNQLGDLDLEFIAVGHVGHHVEDRLVALDYEVLVVGVEQETGSQSLVDFIEVTQK